MHIITISSTGAGAHYPQAILKCTLFSRERYAFLNERFKMLIFLLPLYDASCYNTHKMLTETQTYIHYSIRVQIDIGVRCFFIFIDSRARTNMQFPVMPHRLD